MKGLRKKAVVLTTVVALAMTSLMGCARDLSVDNDKVAAVVGDSEITLGVLNFYLRYDQSSIEAAYGSTLGDNFWKSEIEEGYTLEENEKESVINRLAQMYILEDHMEEYGVTITEEDVAKIESAADEFIAVHDDETNKLLSADKEIIKEVLRMCTVSVRMYNAIIADVSTEVSDEEAAQKKIQYALITAETEAAEEAETEGETETVTLEQAKEEAELFLEEAKENGDLMALAEEQQAPAHEYTFDSSTTALAKEIVEAADKLEEGEFAELIEAENDIYYVVQLISEFDEDATETKKEQIVAERQNEKFEEVYKPWQDSTPIVIDDTVVDDISLHGLKVILKEEEK